MDIFLYKIWTPDNKHFISASIDPERAITEIHLRKGSVLRNYLDLNTGWHEDEIDFDIIKCVNLSTVLLHLDTQMHNYNSVVNGYNEDYPKQELLHQIPGYSRYCWGETGSVINLVSWRYKSPTSMKGFDYMKLRDDNNISRTLNVTAIERLVMKGPEKRTVTASAVKAKPEKPEVDPFLQELLRPNPRGKAGKDRSWYRRVYCGVR